MLKVDDPAPTTPTIAFPVTEVSLPDTDVVELAVKGKVAVTVEAPVPLVVIGIFRVKNIVLPIALYLATIVPRVVIVPVPEPIVGDQVPQGPWLSVLFIEVVRLLSSKTDILKN